MPLPLGATLVQLEGSWHMEATKLDVNEIVLINQAPYSDCDIHEIALKAQGIGPLDDVALRSDVSDLVSKVFPGWHVLYREEEDEEPGGGYLVFVVEEH
jgi:hypothetical protein